MNDASPQPQPAFTPTPHLAADELRIRNWLRLRRELAELHARLEYLKLMVSLGVSR